MSVIRPFAYTVVADSVGPEDESSSGDDQRASMTIQIDLSKNKGLQRADIYGSILGFPIYHPQIFSVSNPKVTLPYISRVLPWRHPYLRWLWATTISNVQGRRWVSKNFAPVGNIPLPGPGYAGNLYSAYKYLRLTIGYTCPPYDVLSDLQVGATLTTAGTVASANPLAEFRRFQEEEFEFSQELITRKGTYYRWSRAVAGRFTNGLEGQTLDIGLTIRAAKGVVVRRWHQVPRWGLFGPTGRGRPQQIIDGIAKINDGPLTLTQIGQGPLPFEDRAPTQYDKGTLLCLPPKFIRTNACVPNSYMFPAWTPRLIQSVIDIDDFPPRTYVVEQRWLFFDPPTEPGYPIRGHNLVPIPASKQFGGIVPTQTPFFYMVSLGNDLAEVTGANTIVNKGIYTHYPFENFTQVY